MPRRLFTLVIAIGFLAGWIVPQTYSAEATQPSAKPAEARPLKDDDYRLFKTLVDVMDQVERNYVKDIDRKEILNAAIKGVLEKLDPYSNYIPPENMSDFRTSIENQFGGIGILIGLDEDRGLKVISPLVGTPAYRAGVQSGDRIVKIEGKSTEGFSTDDAQHALKGKPGSKVTFSVLRPAAAPRSM